MKNKQTQLFLLTIILTAIFNIASAQTRIGVTAGIDYSNVTIKNEIGEKDNTQSVPGIHLGITADIPMVSNFFIQPGISYSRKGFKQATGGFFGSATNFNVNADYIEIPVLLLYKPQLIGGHLLLGAGPYIGFGTGGNWRSDSDIIVGGDMNIGKKGDVIFRNNAANGGSLESYIYGRPVDYGANFLLGYEFLNKLFIQLNSQIGLANLQPRFEEAQSAGKLKNSTIGISLGYKF